jgi:hypothetical protein
VGTAVRILDDFQYRASSVGYHGIAFTRVNPFESDPAVFHRHELPHVFGIQRPAIDHLRSMGIDDFNTLPFFDEGRLRVTSGNLISLN